jgi:hypothetical protein
MRVRWWILCFRIRWYIISELRFHGTSQHGFDMHISSQARAHNSNATSAPRWLNPVLYPSLSRRTGISYPKDLLRSKTGQGRPAFLFPQLMTLLTLSEFDPFCLPHPFYRSPTRSNVSYIKTPPYLILLPIPQHDRILDELYSPILVRAKTFAIRQLPIRFATHNHNCVTRISPTSFSLPSPTRVAVTRLPSGSSRGGNTGADGAILGNGVEWVGWLGEVGAVGGWLP